MRNFIYIFFGIFGLPAAALAQAVSDTLQEAVPLQETVVSATGATRARTAVAQQVAVLRRQDVERANAQTTAELLANHAGIFVQKSQQGGGSPVLRGFEANRVLLLVDGIRMNNAVYRSGHLQNVITVDNAMLDRAEVLFGPASTVYGSDALGGAVCFYTKNPVLAAAGASLHTTGQAFFRYGTVNEEKTGHADISLGGQRLGSITSFTFSDFGDLRMGGEPGPEGSFGERPFYVERIGGGDSLVRNDDPLVQRFSGYRQYDLLQKLLWKPSDRTSHVVNLQYSTSSDVPRYDRLTDPDASTGLRNAEWYYGPQERLLAAYTFSLEELGWFDGFRTVASWQSIEESRHQRRFGRSGLDHRTENVGVFGLISEVRKNLANQSLRFGLDVQANDVQSTANRENLETGALEPLDTRYPDGGGRMNTISLFANHQWTPAGSEAWSFSEGLRVGYADLRASFVDQTFFPFPFDEVSQRNPVWSASLGAVWRPAADWRLALNAASGFRVPNIDDLGKVFESQPGLLVVPNPDLEPELSYNLDLNLLYQLSGRLRWENVVWVTELRNAIASAPFTFNGQAAVVYNDTLSQVVANQNNQRARLFGFSSQLEADATSWLAFTGSVSWTRGRIVDDESAETPLDHIPPLHGRLGARWHRPRAAAEAFVLFHGEKPIDEYRLNSEDNEAYARPTGTPAWFTVNLRGEYQFGRHFSLQAGLENLLDRQYRVFASGINAPGRNLFVTARVKF